MRKPAMSPWWAVVLLFAATTAWASEPVAGNSDAEPDADVRVLLARMGDAMRGRDYEGTFIYRRADHVDTLQVFHRGSGGRERERLITLAGKAREIVRDGDDVRCILPDRGKVLVGHQHSRKPFPTALFDNPEALFPLYRFERDGGERIAGRDAEVIQVSPRDAYRFGHRLWVDSEAGLLLRSDVIDEAGEIVEQIIFTNVDVNAQVDDAELAPSTDVSTFAEVPDSAAEVMLTLPAWSGDLPPGYQLIKRRQRHVGADQVAVEHLLFSDGLSSVSVFIDPAPERDDLLQGDTRHGAASAFGAYHDGRHVTVVGEVPVATVEFIGARLTGGETADVAGAGPAGTAE